MKIAKVDPHAHCKGPNHQSGLGRISAEESPAEQQIGQQLDSRLSSIHNQM